MTIGFDASRAFLKNRTGTENYSYQVLKALSQIDSKNTYMVYMMSSTLPGDAPSGLSLRVEDLQGWPKNFQFKIINFPRLWTQVGLAIQTFKDKLDVLFVPAHTLPLIRKPGLKTVVTVHDLGSEYLPSMHQLKQKLYLSFIQKFQLKSATRIIAVSKATKKDLIKKIGIYPINIEVIYEAYNSKLFRSGKADRLINSLIEYGLKAGEYFLFVGTIQPRKNLDGIIEAFSVIPANAGIQLKSNDSELDSRLRGNDNLKLVIVGQKGWLSDGIYKLPEKLGIEDRVKFLGYVPDEKLPALYSGAIALLFPSLFEGFGLPILEAQACGCPVITSNISSMPEVAGKGAVFVNPYSVDDIVEGMKRFQVTLRLRSGQAGYRLQLIKKGFQNVKRFSWEKCAKETLKVLTSS